MYDHWLACSSHTDESDQSKPSHATLGIFMPDAVPVTTLPISRLGDWLTMYWRAYLEARLCVT